VTVLSVLVEAELKLPAGSVKTFAAIEAVTVPVPKMLSTATLYVLPEPVIVMVADETSAVEPASDTLVLIKLAGCSLKTTVKLTGCVVVGSAWPAA